MVCLSKGLTGGFLPMGATVAGRHLSGLSRRQPERAFLHGHSYTANPLGCAAGLVSLDLLLADDCQARIAAIESIHRQRLGALAAKGKYAARGSPEPSPQWICRMTGLPAARASSNSFASVECSCDRWDRSPIFCRLIASSPEDLHRAWDALEAAVEDRHP